MLWFFGFLGLVTIGACIVAIMFLLYKIEQQFHTNHGTSFKDAMNRMEDAAERIERGALRDRVLARGLAIDLAEDRALTEGVAVDLEAGHTRANTATGDSGAAADAQAKTQL